MSNERREVNVPIIAPGKGSTYVVAGYVTVTDEMVDNYEKYSLEGVLFDDGFTYVMMMNPPEGN